MRRLNVEFNPAIKRLDIATHGVVSTSVVGKYKSAFRGKGLEFESYREYVPTLDDASMIDWKASLRANKELVKEYIEERNLSVFFLIDTGMSMAFGTEKLLKNEYAANVATSICYAVLQAGDSVGFGLFSDRVFLYRKPVRDVKQFYVLANSLIEPKHYGGGCNLGQAIRFVTGFLPKRSVLVIVSDFIGVGDKWEKDLLVAGKIFDVVGIMVRDPIDEELPESHQRIVLEDAYSEKQIVIEPDKVREPYKKESMRQKAFVKNAFVRAGGDVVVLRTDKPFISPIQSFFRKRTVRLR
ncbi:DUF58 domain-containing protein [Candidatus Woesearchaeota archaeon]|nr:DUF58 domain-containing protein [Candidatus Woesearchaeota archaeon]